MANATEELHFCFLSINLNSQVWLVAAVSDSAAHVSSGRTRVSVSGTFKARSDEVVSFYVGGFFAPAPVCPHWDPCG